MPAAVASDGEVAERLNAPVLKTGVVAIPPWVRIPPSPPKDRLFPTQTTQTKNLKLHSKFHWRPMRCLRSLTASCTGWRMHCRAYSVMRPGSRARHCDRFAQLKKSAQLQCFQNGFATNKSPADF
jgi:hypothetical protein